MKTIKLGFFKATPSAFTPSFKLVVASKPHFDSGKLRSIDSIVASPSDLRVHLHDASTERPRIANGMNGLMVPFAGCLQVRSWLSVHLVSTNVNSSFP